MPDRHITISSSPSIHAFSLMLKTEGISLKSSLKDYGVIFSNIDEYKRDFEKQPILFCPSAENIQQQTGLLKDIFALNYKNFIPAKTGYLKLKEDSLFKETSKTLSTLGFLEIEIPIDGIVECDITSNAEVLAEIQVNGKIYPALIKRGNNFFLAFDLGKSFLSLLTETYSKNEEEKKTLSPVANFVYKIVPYSLRLLIYRRFLKRYQKQLSKASHFTTKAPIDPAGWTLYQIFINILDQTLDFLPRIWKWPNNYDYAFCFTHDIEPTKFAYYKGLPKLLETLQKLNLNSSVSIVADPFFDLPIETLRSLSEQGHEIISHGLHHDGRFNVLTSGEKEKRIKQSRLILEKTSKKQIEGFRVPWLQRTADLGQLLANQSIAFDSSYIDVDTSLKKAWHGKGISFNFPFKMFSVEKGITEFNVLEIPLTGPQDMEPYFAGLGLEGAKKVFNQKQIWTKAIGGLYVFLAHAGVYGQKDLKIRMELLKHLHNLVKKQNVWIATLGKIYKWWTKRAYLQIDNKRISSREIVFEVVNKGDDTVSDFSVALPLRLKVQKAFVNQGISPLKRTNGYYFIPIAQLKAGEKIEVKLSL